VESGETFDVAILDMQMPEMSGTDLARHLRALRSANGMPLLLLSSVGQPQIQACSQWIGASSDDLFAAVLTKPAKPAKLKTTLLRMCAGAAARRVRERVVAQIDETVARRLPLTILLAEDNLVNQKVALKILERMGYRADLAADGLEALQAVERQPYDVVLMDVQMPQMDGMEASQQIRTRLPRSRQPWIVALTANATQQDREECLAAGMDDFLAKPMATHALIEALERAALHVAQRAIERDTSSRVVLAPTA
jgi:CheY-like chemotaxis protein